MFACKHLVLLLVILSASLAFSQRVEKIIENAKGLGMSAAQLTALNDLTQDALENLPLSVRGLVNGLENGNLTAANKEILKNVAVTEITKIINAGKKAALAKAASLPTVAQNTTSRPAETESTTVTSTTTEATTNETTTKEATTIEATTKEATTTSAEVIAAAAAKKAVTKKAATKKPVPKKSKQAKKKTINKKT